MTDDRTEEGLREKSSSEGSQQASASDETVDKMEKGIENIDEEIDDAKEKAEDAERFDPQSQTSPEDGEQNTNG